MNLHRLAGAAVFALGLVLVSSPFARAATVSVSFSTVAPDGTARDKVAQVAATPAPSPAPTPGRPSATFNFSAALLPFEYNDGDLSHTTTFLPSPVLDFDATFFHSKLLFHEEYRQEGFIHFSSTVPTAGGGTTYIAKFAAREYTIEERLGVGVPHLPGVYAGVAVLYHPSNYGFPILVGGGIGLETSADLRGTSATYGRLYFYPNINNEHGYFDATNVNRPLAFRYSLFRGQVDYARRIGKGPAFVHVALEGEHWLNLGQGPANLFRLGPTAGILLKL